MQEVRIHLANCSILVFVVHILSISGVNALLIRAGSCIGYSADSNVPQPLLVLLDREEGEVLSDFFIFFIFARTRLRGRLERRTRINSWSNRLASGFWNYSSGIMFGFHSEICAIVAVPKANICSSRRSDDGCNFRQAPGTPQARKNSKIYENFGTPLPQIIINLQFL